MATQILKTAAGLDAAIVPLTVEPLSLVDAASATMEDFAHHAPPRVPHLTPIDEVLPWLAAEKFPWQLVVGGHDEVLGLLLREGNEERLMRQVAAGRDRAQLVAEDAMIPLAQLHTLDFVTLDSMDVQDLLDSLRQSRANFCLVLQGEKYSVRGLIAADVIAKRLNVRVPSAHNPSFVDIFNAIHP